MNKNIQPQDIRIFFAHSDMLDHFVLRPLSHIKPNWELTWSRSQYSYENEEDSFAEKLNLLIDELARTAPPKHYHDNEDILANHVREKLGWKIYKWQGRWVGADYSTILEYGSNPYVNRDELLIAAVGRVYAAIRYSQTHYDQMEKGHQYILSMALATLLYHRTDL